MPANASSMLAPVLAKVRHGRRRELASRRHTAFAVGLASLVEGDEAAEQRDHEGGGDHRELDAESTVGAAWRSARRSLGAARRRGWLRELRSASGTPSDRPSTTSSAT
jgi:hypothetical protein